MGRRAQEKRANKAKGKPNALPTATAPWEVLLLGGSEAVDGIEGVLVVAEPNGDARVFAPLTAGTLQTAWSMAITEPLAPCRPARPLRVQCVGDEIAVVLRQFVGVPVDVVDDVPAARQALEALMGALADHATELTCELPRWRTALQALADRDPADRWPEPVQFRFRGDPLLEEAVAEAVRSDGSVGPGLSLYLSEEDLRRGDELDDEAEWVEPWQVTLEREDERSEEEVADAVAKGLRIKDRIPLVTGMTAEADTLSDAEQRVLLAALEAVMAATHAPEPLPDPLVAETVLGPLTVTVTPRPPLR